VAIGAALAPQFRLDRLLWTLAAFFLALGISAHALDELNGRPLRTAIPRAALVALALVSLAGAVAIGVGAAVAWGLWLLAFVAVGGFLVPAYNLELFRGRFHTDVWFGLAWGAFPLLTAYFAEAQSLRAEAILAAAFATSLSLGQRALSTHVRAVRRDSAAGDLAASESALRAIALAVCALAAAVVVFRLG
jgi:1,4-dihydroxy-2-naphthoate octaprenyltransferase